MRRQPKGNKLAKLFNNASNNLTEGNIFIQALEIIIED